MEYSLLYPPNAEHTFQTLTDESINDLSIEFLLNALAQTVFLLLVPFALALAQTPQ